MPIQLTSQAYCKMLLHAAKYPNCAVNGLLVAEKTKDRKKDSEPVLCVDCLPLFHGTLALAPMLEVALTLVSIFQVHHVAPAFRVDILRYSNAGTQRLWILLSNYSKMCYLLFESSWYFKILEF